MRYRRAARKLTSAALSLSMLVSGLTYVPAPAQADPPPVRRVEDVDRRMTHARTFELSDGTHETEVFAEPVFFRDEATATLQPIDTTLEETITPKGRVIRNRANSFELKLPSSFENQWVSVESTTGRLSWRPSDRPLLPEAALSSASTVIRDEVVPTRAAYPGAFQGTVLEYVSTPTGVKETIVVPKFTGRNVFGFDLAIDGLTPALRDDGSIGFYSNESTAPVYVMEAPFMFDSAASEEGPAHSSAVEYRLTEAFSGWKLDIVADRDWLSSKDRVWPVRIDPTVTHAYVYPYNTDAAYITRAYPNRVFNPNTGYEDGTFPLKVGKNAGYEYYSLLKSSQVETALQSLRDLDTDVEILYSRLDMWCYTALPNPSVVKINRVKGWWNPLTVTWNTRPSTAYVAQYTQKDDSRSDGLYVTQLVKDWFANPGTNYGLMLWSDADWVKYIGWDFWDGMIAPGVNHPLYKIAWTTVPKVTPSAPMPDTTVAGQPTVSWVYDDDKHRLAASDGTLITKPQERVEIQFASAPSDTSLLKTISLPGHKNYDYTVSTGEYAFQPGKRYFWRMRAAGLAGWPAADSLSWSRWTDWTGFWTMGSNPVFDGGGIEPHRATEPLGAGAAVELKTGALTIQRDDLSGPARGGALSFGTSYRSDRVGSTELPTGWKAPFAWFSNSYNGAPSSGFDTLAGWTSAGDTTNVSITSVSGGRSGNRLRFTTTLADRTAYVKSHADGTAAFPVMPGERLEASAWMLASEMLCEPDIGSPTAFGGVIKIHFWDASGAYLSEVRSGNFAEYRSGYWQKISTVATAPKNAYFARMNIEFQSATGTLYVDDAYFGGARMDFTDADGTVHQYWQEANGTFTRDPLSPGVGLTYQNAARGGAVTASVSSFNDAPDPGFDKAWATGGWYSSDPYVMAQQTSFKRSGEGALLINSSAFTSVYVSPCSGTTASMMPVSVGQNLQASVWVNTESLAVDTTKSEYGVFLKFHYFNSAGTYLSTQQSPLGQGITQADTNGWSELGFEGVAPANAAFVKFNIEYRYCKGLVYLDDVRMGYGADVAGRATDGVTSSSSLSADMLPVESSGTSYLDIDLGKVRPFSQVRLALWDYQVGTTAYLNGPVYTYRVTAAKDKASLGYSTSAIVGTSSSPVSGKGWMEHSFAPVEARYLRVYALGVDSTGVAPTLRQFRITELEVPSYELGHMPVLLDAAGRVAGTSDLSGNVTKNTFDASGRLAGVADEAGHSIGLTYGANGELSALNWTGKSSGGTSSTENGRVTYTGTGSANSTLTVCADDSLDGNGDRVAVAYHYDSSGRIDRVTDADGIAITLTYANGKVATVTYADGSVKTITYGTETATVKTTGVGQSVTARTTFEVATQRVTKVEVDPDVMDLESSVSYDCYGGVAKTTDPMGHVTETIRDGHGNVVRTNDELDRKTTAVYKDDLAIESRDAKDNLSTAQYDDARRLLTATTALSEAPSDEDGAESADRNSYDGFGNQTLGNVPGSTAVNLLSDPCFSSNVSVAGQGWDGETSGATSVLTVGTQYLGSYYVRLLSASGDAYRTSDVIDVNPEHTYMLSAWTRGEGMVRIKEYDAKGVFLGTRWPILFTGSTAGQFARVSGAYWPNPAAAKVKVQLWAGAGQEAHFDNVRFEPATRIGADNFVDNASFERMTDTIPTTWSPRSSTRTNALQKGTWDVAVSGARSAYIKTSGGGDTYDGYFYSGWVGVNPGERYSVSGSIKTRKLLGEAHLDVLFITTDQQEIVQRVQFGSATGDSEWRRYIGNVTVPSGATFMRLSTEVSGGAGEAYFDAVAAEPVRGVESFGYDAATSTYRVTQDSVTGHRSETAYDARGRVTSSKYAVTPGGASTVVSQPTYDSAGRLASVTSFPSSGFGISASYTYSAAGRLTGVTDPLGRHYELTYDSAGRLASVRDPLGGYARTLYDGLGRTEATVWPSTTPTETRVVTRNAFDAAGRPSKTTYYDANGTLAEEITTSYDKASRVTGTSMAVSGYSTGNTYDAVDRLTNTTASGPGGTTSFSTTYDVADLPVKTTWSALGRTRSIDTTYAKTGELTRMTVGDGTGHSTTHNFAFDVAGRLTRSASALGTRLLSYDPAGRLSTVSLGRPGPDGTLVDFASQKVGYDGWERIASVETRASDGAYSSTDAYTYDAAGRIATWNRSGWAAGSNSYGFDAAGNLTSRKVGSTLTGFAYNAANQLATETVGSVVTTHTYDEFGRLTRSVSGASATTYAYDALGKLANVSRPGMSAAYTYGPSGMRERKDVTTSGVTKTTRSAWSGMTLVAEKDGDGTTYEYVYAAGVPLELIKTTASGATTRYGYQTDAAGSVIGITDEAGAVIARYAYDAYGVPTESWGSDPVVTRNPLRYRGYYWDNETGLYYLPARYYEPKSARFLSVDPAPPSAGDPVSLNRYAYCAGDPVDNTDPTGAVMTEYYVASERAAIGEEQLARGRTHHSGYGGTKSWSKARQNASITAGRARDLRRLMAGEGCIPTRDMEWLLCGTVVISRVGFAAAPLLSRATESSSGSVGLIGKTPTWDQWVCEFGDDLECFSGWVKNGSFAENLARNRDWMQRGISQGWNYLCVSNPYDYDLTTHLATGELSPFGMECKMLFDAGYSFIGGIGGGVFVAPGS